MISLNFDHPAKHSLKQLRWIEECLLNTKKWSIKDALRMAHQLVVHDHPSSQLFLEKLSQLSDSTLLQDRLNQLYQLNHLVQKYDSSSIKKNEIFFLKLYDQNEFLYVAGKAGTSNLLIVFTTIYNNFGISNLLLYSILKQRDCSILFVKDPTYGCYMASTKAGNNLNDMVIFLKKIIKTKKYKKSLIMGYSSSGYSSWYVALKLGAEKFLGFSLATDLSSNTILPTATYLKQNIRDQIDDSQLLNLATIKPKNSIMKSKLVVGEFEHIDLMHAENMLNFQGVEIEILSKTYHDTPEAGIRMGFFEGYLDWLFA